MTSFKRAAVKVLRDSKEPLHYKEITKRALEEALIETSGATPERTMNTQITGDMKRRGKKSAFIRVRAGVYSLNPDYAEDEQNQSSKARRRRNLDLTTSSRTGSVSEGLK
ncbi:MAG: winged helix-turn-helix domain-containing protein [Halobacteriota archaeon]|jgi:hypothetical protein